MAVVDARARSMERDPAQRFPQLFCRHVGTRFSTRPARAAGTPLAGTHGVRGSSEVHAKKKTANLEFVGPSFRHRPCTLQLSTNLHSDGLGRQRQPGERTFDQEAFDKPSRSGKPQTTRRQPISDQGCRFAASIPRDRTDCPELRSKVACSCYSFWYGFLTKRTGQVETKSSLVPAVDIWLGTTPTR